MARSKDDKANQEADQRFRDILKSALDTPPIPMKAKSPKKGAGKAKARRRLPVSHQDRKNRRQS